MSSGRSLVVGWAALAVLSLVQAPRLYGDGDPNCPNCQKNAAAFGLAPLAAPVALPPPGTPVEHEAAAEPPPPIVKVRVKAPACAVVGQEMEYRFKVENASPSDAHNVVVRTSLPASVRVLRTSPHVHQREPELQWNLGTVPAFGCHDLIVVATPIGLADVKSCTRVQYEHGQCTTTKVMAFAPDGSAEGREPAVGPGGFDPRFPGGVGPGAPLADIAVKVLMPEQVTVGQPFEVSVTVFNKSTRPLYEVGATFKWPKELEMLKQSENLLKSEPTYGWLPAGLKVLEPTESRTLRIQCRALVEGRICVVAGASAIDAPDVPGVAKRPPREAKNDEACVIVRRPNAGMTLEMHDRDDPILRNGQTSYPITLRNQGGDPLTNVRIKAQIPDLLELDQAPRGPTAHRTYVAPDKKFWVEFDALPSLASGESRLYEIFVKARGREGDCKLHLESTADQLDKTGAGDTRWIVEEEPTTIVPDEDTRLRIREISRKKRV